MIDSNVERALGDAHTVYFPAGTAVFRHGQVCQRYLIVSEGSIRVQKVSASGRELILYRVQSGQSCVLSTTCLLAGETYPADGITETPVRAAVIPKAQFEEALRHSPAFRRFVFASFAKRISGFIMLLEEVAFARMDCRLAQNLLDRSTHDGVALCTHHTLAAEFGTAREVVSRLLKEFERSGWVKLGRGRILIKDREGLRQLTRCDSPE
jgi:CRP/FNR family transcriptional regulator